MLQKGKMYADYTCVGCSCLSESHFVSHAENAVQQDKFDMGHHRACMDRYGWQQHATACPGVCAPVTNVTRTAAYFDCRKL